MTKATDAASDATEQKTARGRSLVLFAVGLLLALYVAWQVREVLLLVYVSGLFAVVLSPLVQSIMRLRIRNWHPGRGMALAVLLLGSLVAVGGFFLLAVPPAWHDLLLFLSAAPASAAALLGRIGKLPWAQNMDVGALNTQVEAAASASAKFLFSSLPGWAGSLGEVLTGLVLTIYFILEGDGAYQWFLTLVPVERRDRLDKTLRRADVRMGRWLLGQGSLMLILGVASTVVYGLLGVKYFYLLGALMGLANIIPVAGAVVTVAISAMVAGVDSWEKMVGVLVFYGIYAQIENAYLVPRIMQSRVNLSGLAVLISLLVGAALAGLAGAVVAVPTAALVAVLVEEYVMHDGTPENGAAVAAKGAKTA